MWWRGGNGGVGGEDEGGNLFDFSPVCFFLQMSPQIENLKVRGGGGQRRR